MLNTKIIKQLFGPADSVKYTLPCKPGNTVLVIAPHPDDETLGCGGIIAQMLQNDVTVAVLLVTDGNGGSRMPNIKKFGCMSLSARKQYLALQKISAWRFLMEALFFMKMNSVKKFLKF